MNLPVVQPPRCARCSSILEPPGSYCGRCGHSQQVAVQPPNLVLPVQPKSPGVAVLLSFFLLGGGFLYLNRVGAGVALLLWDIFLFLLILIPFIGWVAAPLLWLVTFAIVAPLTYGAANDHNRRALGAR